MALLNPFVLKKYGALLFVGLFTVICFYIGLQFYGLWIGLALLFVGLIVSMLVSNKLLTNPFTEMLEGKGILTLNIDSTGVIQPFIVGVHPPYIKGSLNRQPINDVFDRDAVFNLSIPIKNKTPAKQITEGENKGGINITLNEKDYNDGRFALFQYPVLIFNNQIKSIVTKGFLASEEKHSFAEHGVLYLNRKMEELTSAVRDFGRHVVELTKPKEGFWQQNKAIIIIVMILVGLLIILFAPKVMEQLGGVAGSTGGILKKTAGTAITPIG